jgi:transcriptional regulator with XRE-family HTH domain
MLQVNCNPFVTAFATMLQMGFGKWLKEHRNKADMTLKDVAARSGLSFSYVSTLERDQPHSLTGKSIRPTPEKVRVLVKAVGGDIDEALQLAGYAGQSSAGFLFRLGPDTGWDDLTDAQKEAVRELTLATIRSLASVSKDILDGIPIAPTSKTPILKRKSTTEHKRKAQ